MASIVDYGEHKGLMGWLAKKSRKYNLAQAITLGFDDAGKFRYSTNIPDDKARQIAILRMAIKGLQSKDWQRTG